jgi:hypothetical protein
MDDWELDSPTSKKASSLQSDPAVASASPAGAKSEPQPSAVAAEPAVESDTPRVPASARRGRRVPLAWVAAGLALLLVGVLVGFLIARSQAGDDEVELAQARQELSAVREALSQAEERNWDYYRENEALKVEVENLEPGNLVSTPRTVDFDDVVTPGTYGDGIYLVGEDIAVGTYDGVVVGAQGYWARLKGTDGLVSQIVANAIPRGPFVLTIVESDKAVELRGVRLTAR